MKYLSSKWRKTIKLISLKVNGRKYKILQGVAHNDRQLEQDVSITAEDGVTGINLHAKIYDTKVRLLINDLPDIIYNMIKFEIKGERIAKDWKIIADKILYEYDGIPQEVGTVLKQDFWKLYGVCE